MYSHTRNLVTPQRFVHLLLLRERCNQLTLQYPFFHHGSAMSDRAPPAYSPPVPCCFGRLRRGARRRWDLEFAFNIAITEQYDRKTRAGLEIGHSSHQHVPHKPFCFLNRRVKLENGNISIGQAGLGPICYLLHTYGGDWFRGVEVLDIKLAYPVRDSAPSAITVYSERIRSSLNTMVNWIIHVQTPLMVANRASQSACYYVC